VVGALGPARSCRTLLATIDRLLRVRERRARLLGLDARARSKIDVLEESTVDRAIADLEAELARRGS
jgi:hypothetical protein